MANDTKINKNVDITIDPDTREVVVYDRKTKKEFFRQPKNKQTVSIAHDIYMCHKYEGD